MTPYKFYMSRNVDNAWEAEVSLEEHFTGLKYVKCDGLLACGKQKNVYTETYAETSEMRMYVPNNVARENGEITFTFGFEGQDRRKTYLNFLTWVSGHKIKYRDTARNVEVTIFLTGTIEPSEDLIIGSSPYMLVDFIFTNITGSFNIKTN